MKMDTHLLQTPFRLPCGAVLANRLVKAATTERLSKADFFPPSSIVRLYDQWADAGAGLMISGNILVDRRHLESAGNVVADTAAAIPYLKTWTAAARKNGQHFWAQISHAGRQTNRFVNWHPKAPSAVQLKKIGLFGMPRAMSTKDIEQIIRSFVQTAVICREGGFTGVQIHAAHGYLLSQFLSPATNQRSDEWGGSLENRSRLLLRIVREVRQALGADFPISVKINSADFQKGGFSEAEALEVVHMLSNEKIDLLEISGGTYEKVAFFLLNEDNMRESTRRREAYFIDFAQKVRAVSTLPLMVTGGFRTYVFADEVLRRGELDFIGMARPFIVAHTDIPAFMAGKLPVLPNSILRTGLPFLEDAAEAGYYARQIIRLGQGKPVHSNLHPLSSVFFLIAHEIRKALSKRISSTLRRSSILR
ncbi:MAG TPA: NADH:flavin oxidoreductase/NADH oxidase family protein [Saprospiraceae bacterium]|nr:NADH:flavin oxidoreductase/NADH oxidase family protein [Saprospiraceae bacterium]HMQ83481.1 NADH:flavin oxidoreductase/NADH oxidase family protein [Saprospiraceae bacterium]